jgi:tetratricopeptide (TPR) repeat protein
VEEAKKHNPGQPSIVSLEATVCLAAKKWECAVSAYNQLAVVDTAAMNVQAFERLVRAHKELGQPREGANAAGRGVTKFPDNVNLILIQSQMQREAGDTAASLGAARKALALDPTQFNVYLLIAGSYGEPTLDSLMAIVERSLPHATTKDDSATAINMVFSVGQSAFDTARTIHADTLSPTHLEDATAKFKTTIRVMEFTDRLSPLPAAKFYAAASHFQLAIDLTNAASKLQDQTGKIKDTDKVAACQIATEGYERTLKMQDHINNGGGIVSRENAIAMMENGQKLISYFSDIKTATCSQ